MTEAKKLASVTGASSGIGLALATEFVQHDYDLVVCAHDEAIHQAADALALSGAVITAIQVDLRTYDGVESLYSTVLGTGRWLNAAALNAGCGTGWSVCRERPDRRAGHDRSQREIDRAPS